MGEMFKEQTWPNFGYCPESFLDSPRKNHKTSARLASFVANI